jgi:hypothetical protein
MKTVLTLTVIAILGFSCKPVENLTKYALNLSIGDTGYATLTVNDNDRQPISFYGKIE